MKCYFCHNQHVELNLSTFVICETANKLINGSVVVKNFTFRV